jgi:hypothetical protein
MNIFIHYITNQLDAENAKPQGSPAHKQEWISFKRSCWTEKIDNSIDYSSESEMAICRTFTELLLESRSSLHDETK